MLKYEHKLRANQLNKARYKPKDCTSQLSISERVKLNADLKSNSPSRLAKDLINIMEYQKEVQMMVFARDNLDLADLNRVRTMLFDDYFEVDNTKFMNVITVKEKVRAR